MEIKTIYQSFIEEIKENNTPFFIDLEKETLRVGGKYLVKDGVSKDEYGCFLPTTEQFIEKVEQLYHDYKYSIPCKNDKSLYFEALTQDKLDMQSLIHNDERRYQRALLEGYLLGCRLNGFDWDCEKLGKWFYQSKTDKSLIILKQWICEE